MSDVRAKFRCTRKDLKWGIVQLEVVYGGSPENAAFFQATPSGTIDLGVLNQAALDRFEFGAEYYVDFTRAPPATSSPAPAMPIGTAGG